MKLSGALKVYQLFIVGFMMTLALTTLSRTLFAQTITIERVWTADGNGTDKSVFMAGDAIRHVTLVRNTYSQPVNAKIMFLASGPTWLGGAGNPANRDIYTYIQRDVTLPVGLAGYYSPWTIPASAQPGAYAAEIGICWTLTKGTPPTKGTSCSGSMTTNQSSFSIPGNLATTMTTFQPDGVTATSALEAGAGEALLYKITITNTGLPAVFNTGVVLTDPLPPAIFDLISNGTTDIFTDHGTCKKVGVWPSITIQCQLGNLTFGETATIFFTASIIVRDPSGLPRPPTNFRNTVYVSSDQQPRETLSIDTGINIDGLSCENLNKTLESFEHCVGLASPIGTLAEWVWEVVGKPLQGSCKPVKYSPALLTAKTLGSEAIQLQLELMGANVGLEKVIEKAKPLDAGDCVVTQWLLWYDSYPASQR